MKRGLEEDWVWCRGIWSVVVSGLVLDEAGQWEFFVWVFGGLDVDLCCSAACLESKLWEIGFG